MQIAKEKVVLVDYTLTDDAGEVLDTSKGHGPLAYLHGTGGIIPGLERALEGKAAGDELKVTIAPEDAYGHHDPKLVQSISRKAFKDVKKIERGMQFQASVGGGMRIITVLEVFPTTIKADANHPLAGKTLHFDVKVVEVREATAEELAHGHVHGPGGDHHH